MCTRSKIGYIIPSMDEPAQKHWLETIFESPYFWGVLTLIAIAYGFSPRESGAGTWISLVFALVTASAAIWFHPRVRTHTRRVIFTLSGTVLSGLLLFPLGSWLTRPKAVGSKPRDPEEESVKPKTGTPLSITEKNSNTKDAVGIHSPNETIVIPPKSSAIISSHALSDEERKDLEGLQSEEREARRHATSNLDRLTVKDLFWTDFETPENTSVLHSGFTIRNDQTGQLIHVSYAVIHQMQAGVKMLAFHIPYTSETPQVAITLADKFQIPLKDCLEQAVVTGKAATGDSEQLSSENLILSNRVFVYYETYLSPEQVIEARNAWKSRGFTVIFRGTDYLDNKKLALRVKRLEKRE